MCSIICFAAANYFPRSAEHSQNLPLSVKRQNDNTKLSECFHKDCITNVAGNLVLNAAFEGLIVLKIGYNLHFELQFDSSSLISVLRILPNQVKTQYFHFRFHANYCLLPWKISVNSSRQ